MTGEEVALVHSKHKEKIQKTASPQKDLKKEKRIEGTGTHQKSKKVK